MQTYRFLITALLLTGLLGFAQAAEAGYFKERQDRQQQRIQHGIASGRLTPAETRKLFRDQRQVWQLKRHFIADGRLSGRERRILDQRLDRSSHRIYRYKNNHRWVEEPRYRYRSDWMWAW
jgi:hypothetical protein